jgi:hypothetical protein
MITQAIKRWLYKLFSWWPWKSAPATGYSQTLTNGNLGSATVWRTTMEGPLPQAGMMSVAVEQDEDNAIPDPGWPSSDNLPERPVQPSSPMAAELHDPTGLPSTDIPAISTGNAPPSPTFEQQLAFLQYLVKRGLVNEGFSEGQVPKQYRRKYEREV